MVCIKREAAKVKNTKQCFQKNLSKKLLQTLQKENDIIYDPFMGLGTELLLLLREYNRKYIGSEISKEYIDIANQRIKNNA